MHIPNIFIFTIFTFIYTRLPYSFIVFQIFSFNYMYNDCRLNNILKTGRSILSIYISMKSKF